VSFLLDLSPPDLQLVIVNGGLILHFLTYFCKYYGRVGEMSKSRFQVPRMSQSLIYFRREATMINFIHQKVEKNALGDSTHFYIHL